MGRVRLRLARHGRRKRPFYRIVAADNQSPRDGRFLEIVGYYDPILPKDSERRMKVNVERATYWLSVGAQPSDTVRSIFARTGVVEPSPRGIQKLNPTPPPVAKTVNPTAKLQIKSMMPSLAMLRI